MVNICEFEPANSAHFPNQRIEMSPSSKDSTAEQHSKRYWKQSIQIVLMLLGLWATISLGCGILFRDWLDSLGSIGGAPLGFWMAQQGSIIGFLVLLFLYMVLMNRLDRSHGYDSEQS
jgi:putative solute:sodium symporter small subunit